MAGLQQALASAGKDHGSSAFFAYLLDKATRLGTPLVGTLELTPRCTLDCSMCYVHLQPHQMHCPELSTEQWLALISQAYDAGMLFARVTGGECMLHPGFREICQALFDRGVIVSILTNGTLVDEAMVDWLARCPVKCVQVSVYGSSPEAYGAVTGHPEAFARINRALTLLKEAGVRFTTPITLSKQIAPDFLNTVRYCHSKGSLHTAVSPNPFPARPETGRQSKDFCLLVDDEVTLLKQYYDLMGVSYTPCALDGAMLEPSSNIPRNGMACRAGRSAFTISWDGWMLPCNAVFWMKANPLLGGFEKAWHEIYGSVVEFQYPNECSRCKLQSVCVPCPVTHYDAAARQIRLNEDVCHETQKLVTAGIRRLS